MISQQQTHQQSPQPPIGCYDPRIPNSYFEVLRLRKEAAEGKQAPPTKSATALLNEQLVQELSRAKQAADEQHNSNRNHARSGHHGGSSGNHHHHYRAAPDEVQRFADKLIDTNTQYPNGADDIVRARLEMSAQLGVAGAQQQLDEARHASLMEKRASGTSSAARGKKLLEAMGHVDGEAIREGGLLRPLEIVGSKTTVVAAAEVKKPPIRGKMSAVLLLRNLVESPKDFSQEALEAALTERCAEFGVLRAVQAVFCKPDEMRSSSGRTNGDFMPCELVRCFVKFDSVAAAFKAAEQLHFQSFNGRKVTVSYFPVQQFTAQNLAAQPDEAPLSFADL